jgi:hypothetical protein
MKRTLSLLAFSFVLLAVWAPRASAQDTDTYIISTYRVAPGQHIAFLEWMANQEAASRDAGLPVGVWYVHQNGASWDFLQIVPDVELTDEQEAAGDAAAQARGLATGAAAGIEFRKYIAEHTDTFAGGPTTAAELLAAARGN